MGVPNLLCFFVSDQNGFKGFMSEIDSGWALFWEGDIPFNPYD